MDREMEVEQKDRDWTEGLRLDTIVATEDLILESTTSPYSITSYDIPECPKHLYQSEGGA